MKKDCELSDVFASKVIRPRKLSKKLNAGLSTIHKWVAAGILPPPHRLGKRFTYWHIEELSDILKPKDRCSRQIENRASTAEVPPQLD